MAWFMLYMIHVKHSVQYLYVWLGYWRLFDSCKNTVQYLYFGRSKKTFLHHLIYALYVPKKKQYNSL